MKLDREFCLKVSILVTVGMLVALSGPPLVDPHLTTDVLFGARHYPYAGWFFLLCPIVFVGTYLPLKRSTTQTGALLSSVGAIGLAGFPTAFLFPPERPHMWVLFYVFAYTGLAALTVLVRWSRDDKGYLNDMTLPLESRLARLRASALLWQQICIGFGLGYLGLIFVAATFWSREMAQILSSRAELWISEQAVGIAVGIYSVFVVIGPLYEAFQETRRSVRLLSSVRRTPLSGSGDGPDADVL